MERKGKIDRTYPSHFYLFLNTKIWREEKKRKIFYTNLTKFAFHKLKCKIFTFPLPPIICPPLLSPSLHLFCGVPWKEKEKGVQISRYKSS